MHTYQYHDTFTHGEIHRVLRNEKITQAKMFNQISWLGPTRQQVEKLRGRDEYRSFGSHLVMTSRLLYSPG